MCGSGACNMYYMKDLSGFLATQRQMILKDVFLYMMLISFVGHVCRTLLAGSVDKTLASLYTSAAVFSELHDQLASLEKQT